MKQIMPQIYTFTGLLAGRVYMLCDDDGLTLVDTSISNAGGKILSQLQQAGFKPGDVKRILITHAHPDHTGSLPMLQKATGAAVYCHALEKPVIEGESPIPRRPSGLRPPEIRLKPTPVTHTLNEHDVLPVLGGLHVIHTPGHAPGHVSFWLPEQRVLLTGDAIFYLLNRMTLPFAMLTCDMDENKRSVRKLADLQPHALLFGHGQPIVNGAAAYLEMFTKRLRLN